MSKPFLTAGEVVNAADPVSVPRAGKPYLTAAEVVHVADAVSVPRAGKPYLTAIELIGIDLRLGTAKVPIFEMGTKTDNRKAGGDFNRSVIADNFS